MPAIDLSQMELSDLLDLQARVVSEITCRKRPRQFGVGSRLYRHPTDPTLLWDGRHKMPIWFKRCLDDGIAPEEMEIGVTT